MMSFTAAHNIDIDNAFAAETRAATPAVVAHHRADLDALRAQFLAGLAAMEAAAANRKTLSAEALAAALVASRATPVVGWKNPVFGMVDFDFDAVEARGAWRAADMAFGGSYKPGRGGGFRVETVWMSAADAAAGEMREALTNEVCSVQERDAFSQAKKSVEDYHRYLQNAAARARNASKRAEVAVAEGTYAIGEQVEVHAMGHWYGGSVVKLGRTGKVTVRYTSGTGVTRDKAVDARKIRKAS